MNMNLKVAIVIPCFKVTKHIESVIREVPTFISRIYVVDDHCPEYSGKYVMTNVKDSRVDILFNSKNLGVGGATKRGMIEAMKDGMDIIVKVDGDGQMDIGKIKMLIDPILRGQADYVKANRFFSPRHLTGMPLVRKIGNAGLSFINKVSSGYWKIMDPTNGYFALKKDLLNYLELEKIDDRYFFESDMLFRLGLINAAVKDVPMPALYGLEESNLKIRKVIFPFIKNHITRTFKRLIYKYFIHDFSAGSIQLFFGSLFFFSGVVFSCSIWIRGILINQANQTGTIILAALMIIIGFQLLLAFLNYDIMNSSKYLPITLDNDSDISDKAIITEELLFQKSSDSNSQIIL